MDRRAFLAAAAGIAAASPVLAAVDPNGPSALRGTLDAAELGLDPNSAADQSGELQQVLNQASQDNRTVFLPAGTYLVTGLVLPERTRLAGVSGATRLVFTGGDQMISADHAALVELRDLVIDGAGKPLAEYVPAIVHISETPGVSISGVTVTGSSRSGLELDRCGGRVAGCTVRNAGNAGIMAVESTGLVIADNVVEDCGNGGILIHRWTEGEDGTIVTGNRVQRIAANAGGTGQNGNGINVFRAHGVTVAGNRVTDCAFSAIRANTANNVHISDNNTARSGEVGIYSEFAFEGAMIVNNIVDGAATGISVANFREGGHLAVVSGNMVRNLTASGPYAADPPGFGVGIAVEADVALSGNVIDGAPRFGILIGWGPYLRDISATGNVVRRTPLGVAVSVVEGAGSAIISDNLISGTTDGAVVGMHWADPATGDLALSGADRYPHLTVERNRVS